MAPTRRDSFRFGIAFVLLAMGVGVAGYMGAPASLVQTTGRVTHVELASADYGPGPRVLNYRYTVGAIEYSGQGILRYSTWQDDSLQTGREVPVFYDSLHPAVSYPLSPPSRIYWIGAALSLAAFGLTAIIWGWRD
jgi:hypothetical protein